MTPNVSLLYCPRFNLSPFHLHTLLSCTLCSLPTTPYTHCSLPSPFVHTVLSPFPLYMLTSLPCTRFAVPNVHTAHTISSCRPPPPPGSADKQTQDQKMSVKPSNSKPIPLNLSLHIWAFNAPQIDQYGRI
ncbi:hypothetical protein FKM82_026342 [Ascaphus truei]